MLKPAAKTRWTYDEYRRLGESGFFRDQRVELIDGEIIEMPPMKEPHAAALSLTYKALLRAFGEKAWVRSQLPLHLAEESEPEPDVSVVSGNERDFLAGGHPRIAMLIVEISDTSMAYDRDEKASLYARAGILDYWILNLNDRWLEVYRNPIADASAIFGHRYGTQSRLGSGESIVPLALPDSPVRVADMLP